MNEIDTSKASREFDTWIAENVIGWKNLFILDSSRLVTLPRYTSALYQAWRVVERITDPVWATRREVNGLTVNTRFAYLFEQAHLWSMSAEEAALAICQAAYAALTKG